MLILNFGCCRVEFEVLSKGRMPTTMNKKVLTQKKKRKNKNTKKVNTSYGCLFRNSIRFQNDGGTSPRTAAITA